MLVRQLIGRYAGQEMEMKTDDAMRCIEAGTAEDAKKRGRGRPRKVNTAPVDAGGSDEPAPA